MAEILILPWLERHIANQNRKSANSVLDSECPDLMDIADKHDDVIEPLIDMLIERDRV
jgi:hypothetical protein